MKFETLNWTFHRDGSIDMFGRMDPIRIKRMLKMCTMYARQKKTKKPCKWRQIPTLTEVV